MEKQLLFALAPTLSRCSPSRRIWWFGAGREKKTKSNAHLKSMEKKSSQTAASKLDPKQERRRIRKEVKGSQCAGKRGGDRATSNAR